MYSTCTVCMHASRHVSDDYITWLDFGHTNSVNFTLFSIAQFNGLTTRTPYEQFVSRLLLNFSC